ncbi:organic cation transporter protein [Anabrus simplex]|uniref:organic cation transporter protein n=1 Tax=Anabrus simplex TaxID=316456 RepID=UPI0035A2B600
MGGDVLHDSVGNFGRWQAILSVLMALLKLPIAWFQLSILVLEAQPDSFWCVRTENNTIVNSDQDACYPTVDNQTVPCQSWEFNHSIFTSTIVDEWHLVCDRSWFIPLTQATFMLGVLLGNVLFGMAADRYGRKPPLLLGIAVQGIVGVAAAFVPWFPVFLVLRFVLALATGGTMLTSFVIVMEIVGGSWRPTVSILYQIPFSLGIVFMAGVAFVLRDWRHFQLALGCVSMTFVLYWWFVPESPRWLLAVGRHKKAAQILERAAIQNGRDPELVKRAIEEHRKKQLEEEVKHTEHAGILDLLRTPRLRTTTLALFFNWFVAGLAFFGMSQNVGALGGDLFINITVAGLIGVPGILGAIYVVRIGRRKSILLSQLIAGAACLLLLTCPKGMFAGDWPRLGLSAISFITLSLYMPALYLFSGELLPTVVRNAGMGAAGMCSRLGSVLAPFVKSMDEPWPYIILGVAPLLGALFLSFLPETQGCPLPDTLEDGEAFGKRSTEDRQNCNYLQVPQKESDAR